ncbi:hypothetical protein M885DRAFT_514359 [Pelagophyceae sp. CCMP2097]|nr:hypothetical protein M885DRAFT_514359 [Pelagophyceae sp. CCMP2097]|mmetsp:Transcript_30017/g.101180  ORF Transcript_30017/g.101180 Transcript_30017/m.101180 type:complete len:530 (-) Transcript_30017:26-1615(-)
MLSAMLVALVASLRCNGVRALVARSPAGPRFSARSFASLGSSVVDGAAVEVSVKIEGARTRIKKIVEAASPEAFIGEDIVIKGWVKTVRAQKALGFLEVNDGSSFSGLQVVVSDSPEMLATLKKVSTGASVAVRGKVVKSGGGKQAVEISATALEVVGDCDALTYPLQKKRHTLEFLRSIAHLRPRTNTLAAVARVRSALALATHSFFGEEGFQYVHSPLITASDCEGAGEMFRVTSLTGEELAKAAKSGDFSNDFFARQAFLTVSGQLSAEAYACALGDVYTFGPTFRAENSQTTRHLAEFWMIEPEIAFADKFDAMANAEALLKHAINAALAQCGPDLAFCDEFYGGGVLRERLGALASEAPFERLAYSDAVLLLQTEIAKDPTKWQFPLVEFGTDLATEHERWLAEVHCGGKCVFVYDYPRAIKSFYMRDNADGKTVGAFDLLAPGVGELIGGSQREERLPELEAKLVEFGLDPADYWWYLDLRKYGSVPHAGYGLGFDRLVCYVTGIDNIRDSIPFPRFPGSAAF